eukprot:3994938-Pyramimonas_sp.AAC.1
MRTRQCNANAAPTQCKTNAMAIPIHCQCNANRGNPLWRISIGTLFCGGCQVDGVNRDPSAKG